METPKDTEVEETLESETEKKDDISKPAKRPAAVKRPSKKVGEVTTEEMPETVLPEDEENLVKREKHNTGNGNVFKEYYVRGWRVAEYVTPKGRRYMKYVHPDGVQKFYSKKQAEKAGFQEE